VYAYVPTSSITAAINKGLYTLENLEMFNYSRDHSGSKKSTETSWSSALHKTIKILYSYQHTPYQKVNVQ